MVDEIIPSTEFNEEQGKLDLSDDFSDDDKVTNNFFKFENESDSVIGKLISITKSKQFDTNQYELLTSDGNVTIGGYSALNSKITEDMIGKKLKIVYLGETKAKKGGRMYKTFDVFVK